MCAERPGLPAVGIGRADQQNTARFENALDFPEQRQRLLQVFDHLQQGDGVKTRAGKSRFFQQTLVHLQASRLCRCCCFGGGLHTFGRVAQFRGGTQKGAAGAADIEQARLRRGFTQEGADVVEVLFAAALAAGCRACVGQGAARVVEFLH